LGLAYPSEPGGILAYFSDGEWIQYTTKNSGFLGSEPTAIVQDDQGRVWIGMAANGVNIFDVNKQSMEEKK
jgi:streptogramin lyase